MSGATIKNLTLNDVNIVGHDKVGAFLGYSKGDSYINSCSVSGYVKGYDYVGGCSGDGYTTLSDVISTTKVVGNNKTGGIAGSTEYSISNCKVYADIVGGDYTGGICGYFANFSAVIFGCTYAGDITGNSYVGGISGSIGYEYLSKCFSNFNIIGKGDYVGGQIGYSSGEEISNSYFCGSINGGQYVGGLIGYLTNGSLESCYSQAIIIGINNIGGLCGFLEGSRSGPFSVSYVYLKDCVAKNMSVSASEKGVGRIYGTKGYDVLIGEMGTPDENKAYNRTIIIEAGVAKDVEDGEQHGTGVSATTLKLKATYVAMGWDFTDTWEIQETECYPYFKTQTAPPVITSQVISGATTVSGKCVDGGTVTLEIDGVKQQVVSTGNEFSFTVSPLQAGHEVRVSAKADGKEQSYYTTEVVSFLGKGKESDPYQISTAADLTQVYRKGYYKLMNDIDLTDYINQFSPIEGWQSIGRDGSETIHFDGDGHKVTGLWCNSTRDNTGLFSCFANGTIKNLTVETAEGKQVKGGNNTGILIGKMINGTVEQCRVSGNVSDGTPVGGMIGLMDNGTIQKSLSSATINTTGENSYVGGLVGEITAGEITECVSTGLLTATGINSYVGGLVGKNSAIVSNSYSLANVTSSYNAAGLVAYNFGTVDKCYATGNLYSNNYAAGVIGYSDGDNAIIKNCAAMNNRIDVTYESQQTQQGGGYGQRIIGGIKNGAPAPEMNNYALKTMQVSLNAVPQKVYDDIMNGVSKDMDDLKTTAPYLTLGWDFYSVWSIEPGVSYPFLLTFGNIYSQTAEPTGIMLNERSISGSNTIHNMIGQRVLKTGKGIFIVNKKKVFVN